MWIMFLKRQCRDCDQRLKHKTFLEMVYKNLVVRITYFYDYVVWCSDC